MTAMRGAPGVSGAASGSEREDVGGEAAGAAGFRGRAPEEIGAEQARLRRCRACHWSSADHRDQQHDDDAGQSLPHSRPASFASAA